MTSVAALITLLHHLQEKIVQLSLTPLSVGATLLGGFALVQSIRVGHYRREAAEWQGRAVAQAFVSDSLAATLDTVRVVSGQQVAMLGDSLHATILRVIQTEQHNDELDRALGQGRKAVYALSATVDSLRASVSGRAVTRGDSVAAYFDVRQEPFTAHAEVSLPKDSPPERESATAFGRLDLSITLDPIPLAVRVGCGTRGDSLLVAPASVSIVGPTWAKLAVGPLSQSPAICNPITRIKTGVSMKDLGLGALLGGTGLALLQAIF